jgi:hypothetical protein
MSKRTKTIIPPKKGWKENTTYLVDVSMRDTNLLHPITEEQWAKGNQTDH